MRPKTSGSVAEDAASGGGGCPVEWGVGDGGGACRAGGTWGRLAEEWAHSGAGLWLLSGGGGGGRGENGSIPLPTVNPKPPLAPPPLVRREVKLGLLLGSRAFRPQRTGGGGGSMRRASVCLRGPCVR